MKKNIMLCLVFSMMSALYAVSVVTKADAQIEYGDEKFYFYVVNNTGSDISLCKKSSNPLIYKNAVRLKITEDDLEPEDLGEKYTSMASIEIPEHHKIIIYQLHGDFYMQLEHKEDAVELHIKHTYEINVDDENDVKIKEIEN